MTGFTLPPEPIPPASFGWVWSAWLELLQREITAEDRCTAAVSDAEREAASHVLEFCRYDTGRFKQEVADGFGLGLRFLTELAPAKLARAVHRPIADAAELAVEHASRAEVVQLRTEVERLKRENCSLRKRLAGLMDLADQVRWIVDELGYPGAGDVSAEESAGQLPGVPTVAQGVAPTTGADRAQQVRRAV